MSVAIPGYERYSVSDLGRVVGPRGKVIRPTRNQDGYLYVRLKNRGESRCMYVHRLVAMVFGGPLLEWEEVHHDDRDRANNAFSNLVRVDGREAHLDHHCRKPRT